MAQIHIVLATYNGEKYIREQLDSILENSWNDFSVEVCDDGSTDETLRIVREYCARDNRVTCHENTVNLGYTKNFLEGIRRSESPYIMLCDQDDIWHRDKIERTFCELQKLEKVQGKEKPLMVFTDAMNYDSETGRELGSFHKTSRLDVKKLDTAHLFMENKCIGCTVMINAAVLSYLQEMPEEIRVHDWWLALICSHFGKIMYLDEMTLHYRQHSGNMIGGSSFVSYMKNRISGLREQRKAIRQTFAQGRAFYEVFGTELPKREQGIAAAFAAMESTGAWRRKYNMLRYGFCKSGLIRNAALLLLI